MPQAAASVKILKHTKLYNFAEGNIFALPLESVFAYVVPNQEALQRLHQESR
jgi:hypothetical protein